MTWGRKKQQPMSLKFKFKTKDEIPADHLPLYAERDGVWMLDEFRSTNVSLLKERDELKQRFEGIDPDEVRSLRTAKMEMQEAAETQQINAGELDKVVESRIKGIPTDLEKHVNQLTTERDALNTRLSSIQIDQGVT